MKERTILIYTRNPDQENLREITIEIEINTMDAKNTMVILRVYFADLLATTENIDEDVFLLQNFQANNKV